MNFIVIIQARMGSSRLPGKVLLPMGKTCTLDYVTKRCKNIKYISQVIVATSILPIDDPIQEWCEKFSVPCFRGSEEDVLSRYIQAASPYNPDYVVRVTADCPFVDYELASEMISIMKKEKIDLIYSEGKVPRGISVEVVSYKALQYIVNKKNLEQRHKEHVTYYAYEFNGEFKTMNFNPRDIYNEPNLRITLDTQDDYKLLSNIANNFNNPLIDCGEVIQYLKNNPEIAMLNSHVQQKIII